jgi:N-acetylglutamate synthase-like GNAT family acetyltransferase
VTLQIREAEVSEHLMLIARYRAWKYAGTIAVSDRVLIGTFDNQIVGLVRECWENKTLLLRGVWVDPTYRRQGVGQQLLAAFVARIQNVDCYCLPFAHLIPFYQRQQFQLIDDESLPVFLAQRLASYHQNGRNIVPMRRTGEPIRAPIAG